MSWDYYTVHMMMGTDIGNCATIIGWDDEIIYSSTGLEIMTQEQANSILKRVKNKD